MTTLPLQATFPDNSPPPVWVHWAHEMDLQDDNQNETGESSRISWKLQENVNKSNYWFFQISASLRTLCLQKMDPGRRWSWRWRCRGSRMLETARRCPWIPQRQEQDVQALSPVGQAHPPRQQKQDVQALAPVVLSVRHTLPANKKMMHCY